jgi:hypothetical protein
MGFLREGEDQVLRQHEARPNGIRFTSIATVMILDMLSSM